MNQHLNLNYAKFLSKILPTKNILLFKNELILIVSSEKLLPVISFLKNNVNCQYKILTSISGTDYLEKNLRFEVSYELLSIRYNSRIRVKTYVDEITAIESITSIYSAADWWEREIWDLFGVFFINSKSEALCFILSFFWSFFLKSSRSSKNFNRLWI